MSLTFSNISLSGGIEFRWPPQVAPTIGTAVALGATTANVEYTAAPGSLVYGTPYSVSFAGPSSGSKLTIPHTTALNIGSSSFTMEAWVYVSAWPATGDFNYVIAQKGLTTLSNLEWQFSLYRNGGGGGGTTSLCGVGIGYSTTNGTTITTTSAGYGTITAGAWHHVAVSRSSGSNARLYVDGTLAYEIEAPFNTNTGSTYIGYGYSSAGYNDSFNGYISNLRIVVGTALYPNNFTPSSASLTAVQNTQLLTCQSSTIVDNSTNQLSITATSATVSSTAPPITGPETTDILSYTAVSDPGGITATLNQATSGNITVTGLSPSTSYTFTVYSTNSEGRSDNSSASNQITTPAYAYALTTFTWGSSQFGTWNGDGTSVSRSSPVQVDAGSVIGQNPYVDVVGGGQIYAPVKMAIKEDGTLWGWGWNSIYYQVDGTGTNRLSPIQVAGSWSMVSIGSYTTMAIKTDGSMWGWGTNAQGQIGTGVRTVTEYAPVATMGNKSWIMVSVGADHTVALDSNYKLFTMGNNSYGQLGLGDGVTRSSPTQVGTSSWIAVAATGSTTFGIKPNGTLWSWGDNSQGTLGQNISTSYTVSPVQVGTNTWTTITGRGGQAYAIDSAGVLWGWGSNFDGTVNGLLGVNSSTGNYRSAPIQVMASGTVRAVAGFSYGGYAIDSNYKLWSWGDTKYGMPANGSSTGTEAGRNVSPVQVGTLSWTVIGAGIGVVKQSLIGQQAYTTSGTYTWIAPAGVTLVSVVAIGGGGAQSGNTPLGGAGGGGLGYKNNITVVPGNSYTVVVGAASSAFGAGGNGEDSYFINATTVKGGGGASVKTGGTYVGDGGGNGGSGNGGAANNYGGNGGAGGYSGTGGAGGSGTSAGTAGSGGGGGGGGSNGSGFGGRGGGVGIYGEGSNGAAGSANGGAGGAGSGGSGGAYGGGFNGSDVLGSGAVRIIWPGDERQFPSTRTADE